MKAGLFVCDHVHDKYQEEFGDYPDMFARLFPSFEWQLYDVYNGQFPDNLDECDVYMATGSLHSVYEDIPWIIRLKEVIRDIYRKKKYFVGFCFGHQLIGESLGGKVAKSPNGWCVGIHKFNTVLQESWMKPQHSKFNALMMCQDQILELPEDSKILASSDMCPVAMIQVGDTMLGIQGHPEFTNDYDRVLIESRIERIGIERSAKALKSLSKKDDSDVLAEWVIGFLNNKMST